MQTDITISAPSLVVGEAMTAVVQDALIAAGLTNVRVDAVIDNEPSAVNLSDSASLLDAMIAAHPSARDMLVNIQLHAPGASEDEEETPLDAAERNQQQAEDLMAA